MIRSRAFVLAAFCLVASGPLALAWSGLPTPHDDQHLVIARPAQFRDAAGAPLKPSEDAGAAFANEAIAITRPTVAAFTVRFPGRYVLWVRAGQSATLKTPLHAELVGGGSVLWAGPPRPAGDRAPAHRPRPQAETVLKGTLLDGPGGPCLGGPVGFEAYSEKALKVLPDGRPAGRSAMPLDPAAPPSPPEGAEGEELIAEAGRPGAVRTWENALRVEHPSGNRPFYWWKIGEAELSPGGYELRLQPQGEPDPEKAPRVDAAFLTTFRELAYPYVGDINAPKASYIRFRMDRLPEAGLSISAALRVHFDPWSTPRVWLNPSGMAQEKSEKHAQPGFTRWYRLQDIKNAPAFGDAQCQLLLEIAPREYRGATQFAVFPHQDSVLREIGWNEQEGLNVSMATDFETHLHLLRTVRDQAREHYEFALAATGGQLFPLTRGELYFGNAWGAATGACADYMAQTLRLLGFNCVAVAQDPVRSRQLYGWTSHAAQYWPPAFVPYDDEEARRKFDEHYRHFFDKERELYDGVTVYQIADEPGEIARTEVSAPLWVYDEQKAKWVDPVGRSDLSTRAACHDCVLEGKVEQHGDQIGFRVAIDNPQRPSRYAYWLIGVVGPSTTVNLGVGRVGFPPEGYTTLNRPGASVGASPTPFKIVYEGGSAALYLGGRLIHQHANLPEKGAFGFTSGPKAITELHIRAIRKDEHIVARSARVGPKELSLTEPPPEAELELESEDKAERAKPKPLREFVEQDWVASGGIPEAHVGFRKWAAARGLAPDLFGRKSWDDVRMLTIASLARTPQEARLFYWSRRYNGYLTPRMFTLAAEAIRRAAPNPRMRGFVALSGHALYFPSQMPLDMFQLAAGGDALMPGISDWMSLGSWRWDSHQAVAFSVAPYNAGARRYGREPISYPMMHCVWPSVFRSYTMLANQVRTISYFNFGPSYAVTEGFWSDSEWAYEAVHLTNNRAALVDDVLASARMRPSRVALLYAMSTEYWDPQSSFADRRASFLGLSHGYFQPELVTEEQVAGGALAHYDALYVLDPWVAAAAQERIADWVRGGGLLCAYANALTRNEYNEPHDLLSRLARVERKFGPKEERPASPLVSPVRGEIEFRPHTVVPAGMPAAVEPNGARVRARYTDGRPAWLERAVGKGKVVYLGHRPGLTYTAKAIRRGGYHDAWADTGRASLTLPLYEARVERELVLSQPLVMASALSTDAGTVILLYNMQPTPRAGLQIQLKEPGKPHSVEAFDGARLVPLTFEYRDGRLSTALPKLDGGQMILVRRKPAPPDDRVERMRERTGQQLKSTEWEALAAGAWFAGFHPEWKLSERIVPLLRHERWEVRRAAAESLGRAGYAAAAEGLVAALQKETDAHALGDELLALARLGDRRAEELCVRSLTHRDAFVRRQALLGAATLKTVAAKAAELGRGDPDLRVRREAIRLIGELDPRRTVVLAAEAFGEPGRSPLRLRSGQAHDRPLWADAVASNEAALDEYAQGGLPGGPALLLAVAARRADPRLAKILTERWEELATRDPAALSAAAIRQRDKALARALFEKRGSLPPALASHLTLILESAFEARLGDVMEDWEAWLRDDGKPE